MGRVSAGDTVVMVDIKGKRYLLKVEPGGRFETNRGYILHDDVIEKAYGDEVYTNKGFPFLILSPSTYDLIQSTRRVTQIIYPKDAFYIVFRLDLYSGKRVIEAGTGSGAFTAVLAKAVMPDGRVFSYEMRESMIEYATKTVKNAGVSDLVEIKKRDIREGFDEEDVDAVFLDLRTPWYYLDQAYSALKPGGHFGCLVPTTNQVIELLKAMKEHKFGDIEVEELILRRFKVVAERFRPEDRMVAHTAYLIFARKLACRDAGSWYSFRMGRAWKNKLPSDES